MDGFRSHTTLEFFTYAQENRIELFRLPAHSTHLTQPLDVGCFQPFKHYHSEAIDEVVRNGESDFNKLDFLSIFQDIRELTFTKSMIVSAFRNTGLVPYNSSIVLCKIEGMQARRQRAATLPPSDPTPFLTKTPRSAKEISTFGKKLQESLETYVNSAFYVHVDRFMKASIASAYSRQIAERPNETLSPHISKPPQRRRVRNLMAQ